MKNYSWAQNDQEPEIKHRRPVAAIMMRNKWAGINCKRTKEDINPGLTNVPEEPAAQRLQLGQSFLLWVDPKWLSRVPERTMNTARFRLVMHVTLDCATTMGEKTRRQHMAWLMHYRNTVLPAIPFFMWY